MFLRIYRLYVDTNNYTLTRNSCIVFIIVSIIIPRRKISKNRRQRALDRNGAFFRKCILGCPNVWPSQRISSIFHPRTRPFLNSFFRYRIRTVRRIIRVILTLSITVLNRPKSFLNDIFLISERNIFTDCSFVSLPIISFPFVNKKKIKTRAGTRTENCYFWKLVTFINYGPTDKLPRRVVFRVKKRTYFYRYQFIASVQTCSRHPPISCRTYYKRLVVK